MLERCSAKSYFLTRVRGLASLPLVCGGGKTQPLLDAGGLVVEPDIEADNVQRCGFGQRTTLLGREANEVLLCGQECGGIVLPLQPDEIAYIAIGPDMVVARRAAGEDARSGDSREKFIRVRDGTERNSACDSGRVRPAG